MQKYKHGDLVQIADDLGPMMGHFTSGVEAIVIGSYADQFGGDDTHSYTLYLENEGKCSWYEEHQLILIEKNRIRLLQQWKEAKEAERIEKSDLDWIFSNGDKVISRCHGASLQALADCFGLTDLWGERGEGYDYYSNARQTLLLAKPFLIAGNKHGWLEVCKKITIELISTEAINRPLRISISG